MKLFLMPISSFRSFPGLVCLRAGQNEIDIQTPTGGWSFITAPYRPGSVPPIRLENSSRLASLIRAGQSLSVRARRRGAGHRKQHRRRNPALRPAAGPAGPPPRASRRRAAQRRPGRGRGPQSVSLQGVSVNASGGVGLTAGNGVSSGGGIVTQLGPPIPSLDPTIFGIANFAHRHLPAEQLRSPAPPSWSTPPAAYRPSTRRTSTSA